MPHGSQLYKPPYQAQVDHMNKKDQPKHKRKTSLLADVTALATGRQLSLKRRQLRKTKERGAEASAGIGDDDDSDSDDDGKGGGGSAGSLPRPPGASRYDVDSDSTDDESHSRLMASTGMEQAFY